jgi:hypothetical protein
LLLLLLIVSYFSDGLSFYLARKQVRKEKTMNNQHQQNLGSLFTDVSYQVVSEIYKQDHHYCIIHRKEDQKKNYLKEMNYPAASGRGIRIKIDSIVDFGVAAGILGFSLLGMVR